MAAAAAKIERIAEMAFMAFSPVASQLRSFRRTWELARQISAPSKEKAKWKNLLRRTQGAVHGSAARTCRSGKVRFPQ